MDRGDDEAEGVEEQGEDSAVSLRNREVPSMDMHANHKTEKGQSQDQHQDLVMMKSEEVH